MANGNDERCYPGYTTISEHLRIGTTTISNYNRLLVWCKLLHIEPGNYKNPNDYYILNIPKVTPEALDSIRQAAVAEMGEQNKFCCTVLARLDDWQPIQAIWGRHRKPPVQVVHPAQMSLSLDATPPAEHPTPLAEQATPPAEHPTLLAEQGTPPGGVEQSETTIRTNNPHQQQHGAAGGDGWDTADSLEPEQYAAFLELLDLGVRPQAAAELAVAYPPRSIQNWIDHELATRETRQDDPNFNPAGFVVAGLRRGEAALLPDPGKPYRYGQE